MLMSLPKIAVIGCGYWGQNLVRKFYELKALAAVCDSNSQQALKISALYENTPIMSMEEIAQSKDIEGVVIASPAALHFKHVSQFLKANKHVFVEKPLALTLEDAKQLQALAKEKNRILMVGHILHYHPAYLKLKELIRNGNLGRIKYLYSNRLNIGKIRTEENVLWSFAPHDITMILGLVCDPIKKVEATSAECLTDTNSDITNIHLEFQTGVKAHIFVSWLNPFKEQKLTVIGDKAMAVFDDTLDWDQKLQIYNHEAKVDGQLSMVKKAEPQSVSLAQEEPLKNECKHFLDCIINGKQPITDSNEAIQVLSILSQAQTSLESRMNMSNKGYFVHESAYVDEGTIIGAGTKIWHFSHILKGVEVGTNVTIGQNVMIGPDVKVGHNCKIQNNVSLYKGVILEEGVFCGPSCVFTNVNTPRAEIERKDEYLPTYVERSVTIGANSTIVCGVKLGAYCFIGAGSVVTRDIIPHALVVGVPAKQIGWVSHAGERLDDSLVCPREGRQYQVRNNELIDLNTMEFSSPCN